MPTKKRSVRYRAKNGIDYYSAATLKHRRAEPGDVLDDLPADDIRWLLEDGHIEPVSDDPEDEET